MSKLSSRILRGGLTRLVLYRPDTGETLDVRAHVLPARDGSGLLSRDTERVVTAAGTRRAKARRHEFGFVCADRSSSETLEAWASAGIAVRAVALGSRAGAHRIWEQPVVPELDPADAPFGSLAGFRVTLFSARFSAPIYFSDDLTAGLAVTTAAGRSSVERPLPAPGLPVYTAGDAAGGPFIVSAYDFGTDGTDGALLDSIEGATFAGLVLPADTYRVRVEWTEGWAAPGLWVGRFTSSLVSLIDTDDALLVDDGDAALYGQALTVSP